MARGSDKTLSIRYRRSDRPGSGRVRGFSWPGISPLTDTLYHTLLSKARSRVGSYPPAISQSFHSPSTCAHSLPAPAPSLVYLSQTLLIPAFGMASEAGMRGAGRRADSTILVLTGVSPRRRRGAAGVGLIGGISPVLLMDPRRQVRGESERVGVRHRRGLFFSLHGRRFVPALGIIASGMAGHFFIRLCRCRCRYPCRASAPSPLRLSFPMLNMSPSSQSTMPSSRPLVSPWLSASPEPPRYVRTHPAAPLSLSPTPASPALT